MGRPLWVPRHGSVTATLWKLFTGWSLLGGMLSEHWLQLIDEIAHILEFPVDAGETDEGNLIQLSKMFHDEPS
jgi:hypothetical protein